MTRIYIMHNLDETHDDSVLCEQRLLTSSARNPRTAGLVMSSALASGKTFVKDALSPNPGKVSDRLPALVQLM